MVDTNPLDAMAELLFAFGTNMLSMLPTGPVGRTTGGADVEDAVGDDFTELDAALLEDDAALLEIDPALLELDTA